MQTLRIPTKDIDTNFKEYLNVCGIDVAKFDSLETHSILSTIAFVFFTTFTTCLICSNCLKRCFPLFCCGICGNLIGCIFQIVLLILGNPGNQVAVGQDSFTNQVDYKDYAAEAVKYYTDFEDDEKKDAKRQLQAAVATIFCGNLKEEMRIQEIDTKVDKLFIAQLVLIYFWYIFFFIGLYMLKKVIDFRGFRRVLNAWQQNIR